MPKLSKIIRPYKPDEINLEVFLNLNFPRSKKKQFTAREKAMLRPIAEVLALLDSNAFFGISLDDNSDDTWYEQYLPEAYRIFNANGGEAGWAGQTSWMKDQSHENDTVQDAYSKWRLLKILSKNRS